MANPVGAPIDYQSDEEECPSAHDITSLSDLPGRRMKTKLWPMSPIESLTAEEVMAIATRDQTPVMIAVMDGDDSGEKFLCGNKKGVTLPPEVAAEGSWAKKYYQQVAVLNDSLKEMQESFLPVWELAKSQQALLVSVEVFDGLLAVANQGLQILYKSWTLEDMKGIITRECDFRAHKQVHYYSVLKNFTMGKFDTLDHVRLKSVEDLLVAGETYLMHHARTNGFQCPPDIRELFQEFLPFKRDRNEYSHPLTLARKQLAFSVLQKLRASVINEEFDFIKGTKNLILLGADYAESVLQSYGKVRQKLFLDPKRKSKKRLRSNDSPQDSPQNSPRKHSSPQPLPFQYDLQIGQSSQSFSLHEPPQSPQQGQSSQNHQHSSYSRRLSLGSPIVPSNPHGSDNLQCPLVNIQILDLESSLSCKNPGFCHHHQSPITSASLDTSLSSPNSPCSQSSGTPQSSATRNSPRRSCKRPRQ